MELRRYGVIGIPLTAQLRELKASGCTKLFQEQVSSGAKRQQLEACLDYLREGDSLIVTKLDRLARNVSHLGQLVAALKEKGVSLRILDLGLDTSTRTGELILNMMGAVAQFERQMMLERQREGIAKAKTEGKYKGRVPTVLRHAQRAREMAAEGVQRNAIAERLGISERSVYRILKSCNTDVVAPRNQTSA